MQGRYKTDRSARRSAPGASVAVFPFCCDGRVRGATANSGVPQSRFVGTKLNTRGAPRRRAQTYSLADEQRSATQRSEVCPILWPSKRIAFPGRGYSAPVPARLS